MRKTPKLIGLCGVLGLVLGVWISANGQQSQRASASKTIKPYVTLTGAHSRITTQGYFRVTSSKEWTDLWLRHVGKAVEGDYDHFFNSAGVPEINFDHCMTIVVFGGKSYNNAGFEVKSITEEVDQIRVRFVDKGYQTGPKADSVTPYGFFIIPRSSHPLVLEIGVWDQVGTPPSFKVVGWREVARIGKR